MHLISHQDSPSPKRRISLLITCTHHKSTSDIFLTVPQALERRSWEASFRYSSHLGCTDRHLPGIYSIAQRHSKTYRANPDWKMIMSEHLWGKANLPYAYMYIIFCMQTRQWCQVLTLLVQMYFWKVFLNTKLSLDIYIDSECCDGSEPQLCAFKMCLQSYHPWKVIVRQSI